MNRHEAEELLPWFVAGTLDPDEAKAVQVFIDSGEISAADVAELSLFADTVAETASTEPQYDPAVLTRVLEQLDATPQEVADKPVVVSEAPDAAKSGWLATLLNRLQWSATPTLARLAIGAQFALLIGLGVMLATSESAPDQTFEVVSHTGGDTAAAELTVMFAPDAAEADLRALLTAQQLSIVAGPSALGVYSLKVADPSSLATVEKALSTSPLVTLVQRVPTP